MADLPERDERRRKLFGGRSGNYRPFPDLPLSTPFPPPLFNPTDWGEVGETTGDNWGNDSSDFGLGFGDIGDTGGCDGGGDG